MAIKRHIIGKKTALSAMMLSMCFLTALAGCASQQERLLKKKQQNILESYRQQVAITVGDPVRAQQLISIAEELYRDFKAETKILLEITEKIKKLHADYGTTRDEMQTALAHLNNQRSKMRETILNARTEALSLTTPIEWQELMKRRGTLLELIQERPGIL